MCMVYPKQTVHLTLGGLHRHNGPQKPSSNADREELKGIHQGRSHGQAVLSPEQPGKKL